MITSVSPFLAFTGAANAALDTYAAVLPGASVARRVLYGPGEEGAEGKVRLGELRIGAQAIRVIDVPDNPVFAMSPSFSVFIECSEAVEVEQMADALSRDGSILMPAGAYDFAQHFAWVEDRFGVNWQCLYGPLGIAAGV